MEAPDLRDKQTHNFSCAIYDEDSFTIVYELAHSREPVSVEDLFKTFGADVSYLGDILSRLQRLGVAAKTGRRWVIQAWAKENVEFLEESMKNIEPEVAETKSSPVAADWTCGVASLGPGTYNGLWTAAVSHVTEKDRRTGSGACAGVGTDPDTQRLAPETSYRGQNEARSNDYK